MNTFIRYFPAAESMYKIFVALAIGLILLNLVWQLFKTFGLPLGIEAENPVKLVFRSMLFILLASLCDYLARGRCLSEYGMNYSDETIAIVALCHDLCKINCYKKYLKNQKDDITGKWEKVPAFKFEDPAPLGHGEKSMFLVSRFIKLTNEEAFAIRYHMGFSGTEDARNVGAAFEKYPLALALYVADMEASNYVDDKRQLEIEIDEEEQQEIKRRYPFI